MENLDKKSVIILLVIVIAIVAGYFAFTYISFEQVQEFGDLPISKDAVVIKVEDNLIEYEWWKASEENGIPTRYKKELDKEGWKVDSSEGAGTVYTKSNIKVLLISSTEYLSISLTE